MEHNERMFFVSLKVINILCFLYLLYVTFRKYFAYGYNINLITPLASVE